MSVFNRGDDVIAEQGGRDHQVITNAAALDSALDYLVS